MKFKVINKNQIEVYKGQQKVAIVDRLIRDIPICIHIDNVKLEIAEWYVIADTAQKFFAEGVL